MQVTSILAVSLVLVSLTQLTASKRRHRHTKRTEVDTIPATLGQLSIPRRNKCGIKLTYGCYCSKARGTLAISCYGSQLYSVPTFQLASNIVQTLNLENNRISDIRLGDFYGLKIEKLLLSNNTLSQLNVLAFWGLEYYLETLNVSYNHFYTVPSPALRLLRHLHSLSFSANSIRHLYGYSFSSLDKLEILSLDHNPIEDIDSHAFAGTNLYLLILDKLSLQNGLKSIPTRDLATLKGLSAAKNNIFFIPNQWFSNLTSLRYLKLDDNHLSYLSPDVFRKLCYCLRTLLLNNNKFRRVPKEALRLLIYLEILELRKNNIKKIAGGTFNCSRSLQILDLRENAISHLSNAAFHGLNSIQKIDLRYNKLITLDYRMFHWSNYQDKEIYLGKNPWLCNCLVKWLKKHYRRDTNLMRMFSDLGDMRCHLPAQLENKLIIRVSVKQFTCDHEYYYYYEVEDPDHPLWNEEDDADYKLDQG